MVALVKLGEPRVIGTIGQIAVEKAKRELDGKILAAVRHLSPFGVKSADIEPAVHQAIRRKAGLR
jgi:hypothetical protein